MGVRSPSMRFVRALRRIRVDHGCWLWLGSTSDCGYGQLWDGQAKRMDLAHRYFYEVCRGPIPAGLTLDHLCRRRNCVRPSHLEPATNSENILRGVSPSALNARKTHCKRGHPFDAENTRYARNGKGVLGRVCRACNRMRCRGYRRSA